MGRTVDADRRGGGAMGRTDGARSARLPTMMRRGVTLGSREGVKAAKRLALPRIGTSPDRRLARQHLSGTAPSGLATKSSDEST
jgi:hypothetical protein